jgi:hypothetical protein
LGAEAGSADLSAGGKRNSKQLIFLAVVVLHGAVVLLLLRATHQFQTPVRAAVEPLVFLLLHSRETPPVPTAAAETPLNSKAPKRKPPQPLAAAPQAAPSQAITIPSETAPKIDWQQEAELAALSGVANGEKERNYRNLGGLSDAQLKWVRDNHMVQMEPGIVWAHPRVEIDKATLIPIIHINDHCVLVLVFVFCSVGHITPNSHLLDHRRDAPAQ